MISVQNRLNLQRTFFYNYKTSSLSTVWWQSPDLWDSYTNNWYLSDLWGSFNLGIAPYVLDNETYTISTLISTLNDISNAYYLQMQGVRSSDLFLCVRPSSKVTSESKADRDEPRSADERSESAGVGPKGCYEPNRTGRSVLF